MIDEKTNGIIGMLMIGVVLTLIGSYITHFLLKGKVVTPRASDYKLVVFSLKGPISFSYIFALIWTAVFGPIVLSIGIISLSVFVFTIFAQFIK